MLRSRLRVRLSASLRQIDWQAYECDGFTDERGGNQVAVADQSGKGVCSSLCRI
jgi:hypothetical protein